MIVRVGFRASGLVRDGCRLVVNLVRKRVEKSVYICIYTSVCIDVVACVEPTQPVPNGVPNE